MSDPAARLSAALADRYRIERELGQGGMATVYLAHDRKHERRVALKVLHPELAAVLGAERFLAEIKTTAVLQHPNILQLFDSGAADGLLYYVMPFVEGETLRSRLTRERQLPVDDAVAIARGVAAALDYAHRHGVIHRDIKPENILLQDGQPLVADFGIALAVKQAGGARLTQTGLSLGTPQYMSPEQATGERELDVRSDVYALGAVTYEMLAGEPPFTGNTTQAIIAKLMTEEPRPLSVLRRTAPLHVEAAVHRALEKLPADRFNSAAVFADALSRPAMAPVMTAERLSPEAVKPPRSLRWPALAAALGLGLALGLTPFLLRPRASEPAGLGRYSLPVAPVTSLMNPFSAAVAISPDGRTVAFVGRGPTQPYQIFVRALADSVPRPVPGTEGGSGPFFSLDGRQIGFWRPNSLMKVPVDGGAAMVIADSIGLGTFAAWTEDGSVVYTDAIARTLRLVSPDGASREVLRSDTATFVGLSVLPGGRTVLTVTLSGGRNRTTLLAVSLRDGSVRDVGLPNVAMAKYVAPGYLVYQARVGGPLQAAPFDPGQARLTGPARAVAPAARIGFRVIPHWDVAGNGTIAYVKPEPFQVVLTDRSGRTATLREDARNYHHPRFSPDGRRIALDITDPEARDLWIVDVQDRTLTRLTFGETANDPFWSPDGRRLAYSAARGPIRGIFLRNADGSGAPDSVLTDTHDRSSGVWSRDSRVLVSSTTRMAGLDVVTLGQPGPSRPIAGSRPTESHPGLSPDGRWL
ncbi:MAG TPA: protein kinase, partial [Gemmatimonadales bacterium]|nr:protein kinase [Gemmatimonadales bacterium]